MIRGWGIWGEAAWASCRWEEDLQTFWSFTETLHFTSLLHSMNGMGWDGWMASKRLIAPKKQRNRTSLPSFVRTLPERVHYTSLFSPEFVPQLNNGNTYNQHRVFHMIGRLSKRLHPKLLLNFVDQLEHYWPCHRLYGVCWRRQQQQECGRRLEAFENVKLLFLPHLGNIFSKLLRKTYPSLDRYTFNDGCRPTRRTDQSGAAASGMTKSHKNPPRDTGYCLFPTIPNWWWWIFFLLLPLNPTFYWWWSRHSSFKKLKDDPANFFNPTAGR